MTNENQLNQYLAYQAADAFCLNHGMEILEMTGKDRIGFLHGFCTADIKGMKPGDSLEAFILNPKGKTIAFAQVLASDESLGILLPSTKLPTIKDHLSKYTIVEDVVLTVGAPPAICGFAVDGGYPIAVSRQSFVIPDPDASLEAWKQAGQMEIDRPVFEMLRIENGFPCGENDVTEDNLAQEFNRTESAISFTKGCYLGQETVARLDALGHTNREMVRICWPDDEGFQPESNAVLESEGVAVGKITSHAWSPHFGCPVSLAMVKKPNHQDGTPLQCGEHKGSVTTQSPV